MQEHSMENIDVNPRKPKKKKKKRGVGTAILTVFLILFLVCIITGGTVALTVLIDLKLVPFGYDVSIEDEVAGVDYLDLDNYLSNQAKTTIIYAYDQDHKLVEDTRLHGSENRLIASLDEMSPYVYKAVIGLEDQRFKEHPGVDWIGTLRSIVTDLRGGEMQGGSTITQQLIKNLTGENKRTLIRKYNEIKNALALERHFSKDEIMEAYLNTIYLDQGCYGIKTGAEYYFGKDVKDLTAMEAAILISITQAPRKNNPILNYDNNRSRAEICVYNMYAFGLITEEEYNEAMEQKIEFVGKMMNHPEIEEEEEEEVEVSSTTSEYQSWYTDYIIETVISDLSSTYGYTAQEAWRMVYYGGLSIISAVDLRVQQIMDEAYVQRETFPYDDSEDAIQSAMVIMEYDGRIAGIAGAMGEKAGNRVLSYATGDPRNPGSCIKPLSIYAPAVEGGYFYWSSYLPNYGIEMADGSIWPTNYGGVHGSMDDYRNLAEAIAPSLNTIPARILQEMGTSYSYSFLRDRFHMSTLIASDNNYAPLAIGDMGHGVTVLDMCAAYVPFGNGGTYYKPYCYYEVKNSEGKTILKPDKNGQLCLSEGTADVMNHLLMCPVLYPNGTAHGYDVDGITTIAKTGTSSDKYDMWICGGTPYYMAATWSGFKVRREINTYYYGSNPSCKIFKVIMDRVHEDLEDEDFEYSSASTQRTFCVHSGMLASDYCYATETGWFSLDHMPEICDVCPYGGYDDDDWYDDDDYGPRNRRNNWNNDDGDEDAEAVEAED